MDWLDVFAGFGLLFLGVAIGAFGDDFFYMYYVSFFGEQSEQGENWVGGWRCEEFKETDCANAIKVDCAIVGAEYCGGLGEPCCRFYNPPDVVSTNNCRLCKEWGQKCVSRVWVESRVGGVGNGE